jgi:predicted nucleic acid-binding protein
MNQRIINITPFVFDASSLINLERQNKLWHLTHHKDLIIIHERIAKEVTKDPHSGLSIWIANHPNTVTHTFLTQESELYIKLRQQKTPKIQDPDAIAISIAWYRNCFLVCDDIAAITKANQHGVKCLTVEQFIQTIERKMF